MNLSPVYLVGNLTADPEVTTTPSGHKKATFSVAVEYRYRQGDDWASKPSFFNVTAWRQTAERVEMLLEKGMGVIVMGRLDQRTWENDEGQKRSFIDVVADNVAINVWTVDSVVRRQSSGGGSSSSSKPAANTPEESPW